MEGREGGGGVSVSLYVCVKAWWVGDMWMYEDRDGLWSTKKNKKEYYRCYCSLVYYLAAPLQAARPRPRGDRDPRRRSP